MTTPVTITRISKRPRIRTCLILAVISVILVVCTAQHLQLQHVTTNSSIHDPQTTTTTPHATVTTTTPHATVTTTTSHATVTTATTPLTTTTSIMPHPQYLNDATTTTALIMSRRLQDNPSPTSTPSQNPTQPAASYNTVGASVTFSASSSRRYYHDRRSRFLALESNIGELDAPAQLYFCDLMSAKVTVDSGSVSCSVTAQSVDADGDLTVRFEMSLSSDSPTMILEESFGAENSLTSVLSSLTQNSMNVTYADNTAPSSSPTISSLPTQTPSNRPSLSPSATSLPSYTPTVTRQPSTSPTDYPTWGVPEIHDPNITVQYDDANKDNEITMNYVITNVPYNVTILDYNCMVTNPVKPTSISQRSSTFSLPPQFSELIVFLDLKPDGLGNDTSVLNDTNPEAILINFCIRVDLLDDFDSFGDGPMTSVVHHLTHVSVEANTTEGFFIMDVHTETVDALSKNGTAQFEYDIDAYLCLVNGEKREKPVGQSESVIMCLESTAEVTIMDIRHLRFFLEDDATVSLTAIRNYVTNAVTSQRRLSGKKFLVQSRLVSRFYSMTERVVTVDGTLDARFGENRHNVDNPPTGRRRGRQLQEETGQEKGFHAMFVLDSLKEDYMLDDVSEGFMIRLGGYGGLGLVAIVGVIFLFDAMTPW